MSRGSATTDRTGDLAVDAAGHVVLAGSINASATANGDALVESFDGSNGNSRWQKTFATTRADSANGLAYGRNGDLYAVVNLGGPFDFGMPILGAAGPAAVVLRIAP